MLSKSQAKAFFLIATLGFSGVFLYLTVDTLAQVPARANNDQLTDAVIRGKTIWDQNNCMGCHTLLGEGAYYAPELTKVVDRRGPDWMRAFMKDPQAMYPGKRRMIQYNFDDQQISDLIAFFSWIGKIDTNGFPQAPDMAPVVVQATTDPKVLDSAPPIFKTICMGCHAVAGQGGHVGPALDGVGSRYTADKLDAWLKDPASVKPGTAMPNLNLDDSTRAALSAWLLPLR